MKNNSLLILAGVGVGAYFLLNGSSASAAVPSVAASSLAPGTPAPLIGQNLGFVGGNNNFVANYSQLLAADPNLANPNYQLNPLQAQQYLNNYQDLQTGLPTWIDGKTIKTLAQAIQQHWTKFGAAEKRIYYPLQPASTVPYVPPPPHPKSTGGSIWKSIAIAATVLGGAVATVVTAGAAAPAAVAATSALISAGTAAATTIENAAIKGTNPALNDSEIELLFTGAAILKEILPLYQSADPAFVDAINLKLNSLLNQYAQ